MEKMEETAPGGVPVGFGGRRGGGMPGFRGALEIISANSWCRLEVSLRPRQGKGLAQGHTVGEVMELGWNHGLKSG